MRVLVCGSRTFNDYELMKEVLGVRHITTIIHGKARGADSLAGRYSEELSIDVIEFPAEWDKYGRSAGHIRNGQMVTEGKPHLVIAFWDRSSRGTQDMINQAEKAGVPVEVVDIPLEGL